MKKIGALLLVFLFMLGCGKEEKKEIVMSIWEGTGEDYLINTNSLIDAYSKVDPNVTLKIEKIPATDYDTAMKIRNTANQLPDIFAIRNKHMYTYKDSVIDLSKTKAAKVNEFAEAYSIDGKNLGLAMYGFNEFVYYRKSIFQELGIEVPKTWGEFLNVVNTINGQGQYLPLAIGGKDLWTTYPYGQFLPYLVKGGDNVLNNMGDSDEPFTPGHPVYEGYKKTNELFSLKPAGKDPLGYGWSQETSMFLSKKAAMMAAGQWYYTDFMKEAPEDVKEDLGLFLMPTRDNLSEPFRYFVTGEVFLSVPKASKHQKEAVAFLDWFFTSDYYKGYINHMQVLPSVGGVKVENSPFITVLEGYENLEPVYQIPGKENFTKIKNATRYDQNQLSQFLLSGGDFDSLMKEWNTKWKETKAKVIGG